MKETFLIIFLFCFGCTGLYAIYKSMAQSEDLVRFSHSPFEKCLTKINLAGDESNCVQIHINPQLTTLSDLWIDFGNGMRERFNGEMMFMQYQIPGTYTIKAYHGDKLIDMDYLNVEFSEISF